MFFPINLCPLVPAAKIKNAAEQMEPIPIVRTGHLDIRITSIKAKASGKLPPSELIYKVKAEEPFRFS